VQWFPRFVPNSLVGTSHLGEVFIFNQYSALFSILSAIHMEIIGKHYQTLPMAQSMAMLVCAMSCSGVKMSSNTYCRVSALIFL